MELLQAAFCDDDELFRGHMCRRVEALFAGEGVPVRTQCFSNAQELTAALERGGFGLLFLDIDMPGLDGVALAERLRALGVAADIVFVSNLEERVFDTFRVQPWGFVRKSRFDAEIAALVRSYGQTLRGRAAQVTLLDADGRTCTLSPESIVYVESAGKLQKLFLLGQEEPLRVRRPLRELEQTLAPLGFLRIHKGFLANYRFIRRITSRAVALDGGQTLPVGRDRLQQTREAYMALMKWKGSPRLF